MTPTGSSDMPIPMLDIAKPTMQFRRLPLPENNLAFLPRKSNQESAKRGRATADVDGEHSCLQKKKRRLRLFLITSRLSPQFSHPATNIVDRGSSKIAVWVKQKAVGRNLLRKAAILNRIRRSAVAARDAVSRRRLLVEQEKEQRQLELARLTFDYGAIDTYTRPVHSPSEPVPPSATVRNSSGIIISGSPTTSPSSSPTASRSPSPTAVPPSLKSSNDATLTSCKSPNAAYALSPPRTQAPSRGYEPHLPSPLGLSNYDALDVEDEHSINNYSNLDDDDDDDDRGLFPYLWDVDGDQDEGDDRHDSPFAPSIVTDDSRATATTGVSQTVQTPPRQGYDAFDAFGGVDGDSEVEDSLWPSPIQGIGTHMAGSAVGKSWCFRGASPILSPADARPLAVQYPGAPVMVDERREVARAPVSKPDLVPACMSPNFRAADDGG